MEDTTNTFDFCFDSLLSLEESFIEDGKKEGYTHGEKVGYDDGRILGLERGFALGEELGTVYGSVLFWASLISATPNEYSKRTHKVIPKLIQLLNDFPASPVDEKYDEVLEMIRNVFKQAHSLMSRNNRAPAPVKANPSPTALSF